MPQLLEFTKSGIYCPRADVYIDPWRPVDFAVITHAHADHARMGNTKYLTHLNTVPVLRHRLGMYIDVQAVEYGETIFKNGVKISLHPAGHIIGSAQVRLEYKGEVWVVSGDYKLEDDGICTPFQTVKCDVFVTESTFGLPIFKWKKQEDVFDEINSWWADNISEKRCSVLVCYALGKSQRILHNLDSSLGKIYAHGTVDSVNNILRKQGISLPKIETITADMTRKDFREALVLAPPSALNSSWMQKFDPASIAIASGWMSLRGARRRRAADRGFVLSDHADWDQLKQAVKDSGAQKIFVTHGYSSAFSRWLNETGYESYEIDTKFQGEMDEAGDSIAG